MKKLYLEACPTSQGKLTHNQLEAQPLSQCCHTEGLFSFQTIATRCHTSLASLVHYYTSPKGPQSITILLLKVPSPLLYLPYRSPVHYYTSPTGPQSITIPPPTGPQSITIPPPTGPQSITIKGVPDTGLHLAQCP